MDSQYQSRYLNTARMLWEASEGDASRIPEHYCNYLSHVYSDGDVSLVEILGRFENYEFMEDWEIEEVVESISKVDPKDWPNPDEISSVNVQELYNALSEIGEAEYDYVEDNLGTSDKAVKVLKNCLESVFGAKIDTVRSKSGRFPTPENNFLQQSDGTFAGKFKHGDHEFEFEIFPDETGWTVTYRMTEGSIDKLPPLPEADKPDDGNKKYNTSTRSRGWK